MDNLATFFLLVVNILACTGEEKICKKGVCVPLGNCIEVLTTIQKKDSKTFYQEFLKYSCTKEGTKALSVCCPRKTEVSQQSSKGAPNIKANMKISATPREINITRTVHKNRRLLPEASCGDDVKEKLIGGIEADLGELPWMALLRVRFGSGVTKFHCGGALISSFYVLTAAHCIRSKSFPASAVVDMVRLGEHNISSPLDCNFKGVCSSSPQDIEVAERIMHEKYNYNKEAAPNDIALLRLKKEAKMNDYVQPICIPLDNVREKEYISELLLTGGWGRTENAVMSPVKLKVELPVLPLETCASVYPRGRFFDTQLCAGGRRGKDTCSGDSGGPLMSRNLVNKKIRWYVTGIVSFGPKDCGEEKRPGIYTKVSKFVDWILDNIHD